MANSTNFTPSTAEQKAQKADVFLKSLTGKHWANNSVARYDVPMNMLVDSYREKLCSSILKRHKALSNRDISFLLKGPKFKVPFYAHMSSTFGAESKLSYQDAVVLQRDAWLGKFDKKFITAFLDSLDKSLTEIDKKKPKKA
tara:strand:- start:1905 stop:2330 length:426 start_codon:yes stop_codon:yes gene_type:complete